MSVGEPASVVGIRVASTMFAALHGELVPHPWYDPLVASEDPYSLFHARSTAMGWLTEAREGATGGFWGMNDAGKDPDAGSEPPRVAWFQVSLTEPVPAGRPLPVQAFLSCAGDVVAHMGALRLDAVRVLLPVQCLHERGAGAGSHPDGVGTLLQSTNWFADLASDSRTPVRITLDGGQDPSIRSAAPGMLRWIREIHQDVFACDSFSLVDDDHGMVLAPAVGDHTWLGPALHRATFRGALAEWSPEAIGWAAAFLSEASAQHGVRYPLMLTASRSDGADPRAG